MLQVAGEVIGFLDGGAWPRVSCAVEGWHRRDLPEHSAQASEHPPRVPCGQDREEGEGVRAQEAAGSPSGVSPTLGGSGARVGHQVGAGGMEEGRFRA